MLLRRLERDVTRTIAMSAADEFGFRRVVLQPQALGADRYRPLKIPFDFRAQTHAVLSARILWIDCNTPPFMVGAAQATHIGSH
jgi:hypothetical protein